MRLDMMDISGVLDDGVTANSGVAVIGVLGPVKLPACT